MVYFCEFNLNRQLHTAQLCTQLRYRERTCFKRARTAVNVLFKNRTEIETGHNRPGELCACRNSSSLTLPRVNVSDSGLTLLNRRKELVRPIQSPKHGPANNSCTLFTASQYSSIGI